MQGVQLHIDVQQRCSAQSSALPVAKQVSGAIDQGLVEPGTSCACMHC